MPETVPMTNHETCLLTVYLRPRDRMGMTWFARLIGRPMYLELLIRAKEAGITHAVARRTLASYSHENVIQTNGAEIPNPWQWLCVEMLGDRRQLETFCKCQADILTGKMVVFRPAELWEISALQTAKLLALVRTCRQVAQLRNVAISRRGALNLGNSMLIR